MTAQISDTFIFKGEVYDLIGMQGGNLVTPEQFGMHPDMIHTACYRGFYATYKLMEDRLYLRQLTLCEKDGNYLPINGIQPEMNEDAAASYRNLNVQVPFTGQIRLATDFIEELYVHMGFQKPTAFRTVYDITLENGRVVELKDRSSDMQKKRGKYRRYYRRLIQIVRREDEISKAFSLDMDKE